MTSRVVEWKEVEVQIREIPRTGVPEGEPPNECEPSYALVYSGHGRTTNGRWIVHLPAISCFAPAPGGDRQPSIVATPTTEGPLNAAPPRPYILVAKTYGAFISIWSFQPNGEPADHVDFSWHCIVEGTLVQ
ncbi:MAG TPA: hypothetical protein VKB93_16855 [Thermoanaerobaculia bacterium]|nr:hypothetical protein [Thermoanaerobaculia bacterium]